MRRAVTIAALAAVIERHKLEPVNGEYQITDEMIAEATAIDEARGNRPPPSSSMEDLKAAIEGKPNSGAWEDVDLDEIPEAILMTNLIDDADEERKLDVPNAVWAWAKEVRNGDDEQTAAFLIDVLMTEMTTDAAQIKRKAKATLIEYLDNVRPGDMDVLSALLCLEEELRELCSR